MEGQREGGKKRLDVRILRDVVNGLCPTWGWVTSGLLLDLSWNEFNMLIRHGGSDHQVCRRQQIDRGHNHWVHSRTELQSGRTAELQVGGVGRQGPHEI